MILSLTIYSCCVACVRKLSNGICASLVLFQWKMLWSSPILPCFSTRVSAAVLALGHMFSRTSTMSLLSAVWSALRREWWETRLTLRLSRALRQHLLNFIPYSHRDYILYVYLISVLFPCDNLPGGSGSVQHCSGLHQRWKERRCQADVWRRSRCRQRILRPAYCVWRCPGQHDYCQGRGVN